MDALLDPFGFGAPGFLAHARKFAPDTASLSGLRVAITGANSGLGLAATRMLTARGATVFMLCRDMAKAEAVRAGISGDTQLIHLDVSRRASVEALELPAVDVLVHNAGQLDRERGEVEGLERTVATHLVGPWRLSHRVRAAHTIWVASGGMYTQRLQVEATFRPPEPFDGVVAYARCKRAQVVVARHLGHHVMHPGWAATPGVANSLPGFSKLTARILRTPEQGADTIVWLAATRPSAPGFWFDRALAPEFPVPFTRHSAQDERALMAELVRVSGVGLTPI